MGTVLRKVGQFELIKNELMGTFQVINRFVMENTKDKGVSYNFGVDTKDNLILCDINTFITNCKQCAGNDLAAAWEGKTENLKKSIKTIKKNLVNHAKKRGLSENFGQASVRNLSDEHDLLKLTYGTSQQRKMAKLINEFDEWCMNYSIS